MLKTAAGFKPFSSIYLHREGGHIKKCMNSHRRTDTEGYLPGPQTVERFFCKSHFNFTSIQCFSFNSLKFVSSEHKSPGFSDIISNMLKVLKGSFLQTNNGISYH